MAEAGRLQYVLEAVDKNLKSSLDKANKGFTDFTKKTNSAQSSFGRFGAVISQNRKLILGFGAALGGAAAALGTFAVKEAKAFESSLANINTLLGLSSEELTEYGDKILDLATTVPVEGSVLSDSLYDVVSAGIEGTADQLEVLEQAAVLGVAGLGQTGSAVDILTSALNAFQIPAEDAEETAGVLFSTVKSGKTTIDELAQSFGQVAPVANAAGITFRELQSATAALTTSGLQTSVAQTQLKALFIELNREGTKLDKAFEAIGISQVDAEVKANGFVETLSKLKSEAGLTDIQFQNLFSSVEAGGAAIALTTTGYEAFTGALEASQNGVNLLDAAFQEQLKTLDGQTQILQNSFQPLLIELGQQIIPPLVQVLQKLTTFLRENKEEISSFISVVGSGFKFLILAITNFGKLLEATFNTAKTLFVDFPIAIYNGFILPTVQGITFLGEQIQGLLNGMQQAFADSLNAIVEFGFSLGDQFFDIGKTLVESLIAGVKAIIGQLKEAIVSPIKSAAIAIKEEIASLAGGGRRGGRAMGGMVPGFAKGGFTGGGAAQIAGVVHGGEYVAPKWQVNSNRALFTQLDNMRKGGTSTNTTNNNYTINNNGATGSLWSDMAYVKFATKYA